MLRRALLIWTGLAAFVTLVGFLRPLAFEPGLGMVGAQFLTAALSILAIAGAAWRFGRGRPAPEPADYLRAGLLWAGLTLLLETVGALLIARIPISLMISNYDLPAGRLWVVVLAALFFVPVLVGRAASRPS